MTATPKSSSERSSPRTYLPLSGSRAGLLRFAVRTTADPAATIVALRRMIAELDRDVAPFDSGTMLESMTVMLFPFRLAAVVASALGLFGLVLAVVGLSGVVACRVAERRREIGIRMALGARPGQVIRETVGQGMRVVAIGVVVGVLLALGVSQLLRAALFGISPADPVTFIVVPALLLGVAVLASYAPARRAARLNPVEALRMDG